jgi:competence protein ComEA
MHIVVRTSVLVLLVSWLLSGLAMAQVTPHSPSETVNINTADTTALTSLPGIGKVRAEAIIAYRTTHGPFQAIDDLKKVPGVGDKTLTALRDRLTVGAASP